MAGSFANPAAATTTYVSDSYAPTPCTTSMILVVDCLGEGGPCGDGIIDAPGEQCDPPNGTNCNALCQLVAFCGDGIVTAPETCDPSNVTAGTTYGTAAAHRASCQTIPYCGDGHVDTAFGETCDPPNGVTCPATCRGCLSGGIVTACTTCEQADAADCPPSLNQVPGGCSWGCSGFSGKSLADCQALLTCIRTQQCATGDDPTPCLCGALAPSVCATSGAPATAPCAAQYAAAAADAAGTVFSQFSNPTTPVGIADNQLSCEIDSACACP